MPVALAQALVLGMKVSAGGVSLQEAKTYKFANETVYDMAGKALHHLLLVGPETSDFWGILNNPQPSHALYAVGATDKRSFFTFVMPAGSFRSLTETRTKAGSFKRFLSPSPGILYLEDQRGRIWDTATSTEVSAEQAKLWRQAQQVLFEQRQKDGILDKIKEDWDRLRTEANKKSLAQSAGLPTLDEVTLPNGILNVPRLLTALEAQKAAQGVSPSYTNERTWCMGWFCAGMGYASVVRKNRYNGDLANNSFYNPDNPQDASDCPAGNKCRIGSDIQNADPLGNNQWMSFYPYSRVPPNGGQWGAWDFGNSGLMPLDVVGCGPMSIIRVFAWYAIQRSAFTGGSNVNFVNTDAVPPATARDVAFLMFEPVHLGSNFYQPKIGRYTDAWHYRGSGLTRDTNMIPGANNWIRDHANTEGQNWEMRGSHKAFINLVYSAGAWIIVGMPITWVDFSQHTWRVRDIARGKIGRDNEPVIALYPTGRDNGLEGHYVMSQAYIVHEGWFSATVFLWITRDKGDFREGTFVNVTDMGAYYSGAGMYRR
ncbi:hypothetical protein [Meiothermus sp.]|uniref:hypothetical protein n=1 Tax=Meiothermus sp. TaxID=1955249 RepID=UPI0021DBC556|nr:hypothetical protein [Meiothermus sp.]GIW34106.1 MAG: hypothetical protein KatS3mg072_1439 [Meiothermus sp.]